MKKLIYKIMGYTSIYNPKTDEVEQVATPARVEVENPTEQDIAYAEEVAYNGEYTIEGEFDYPTAPHNILKGEYVTIGAVLYKATANIPNGERVILGQNAVQTTIEEQLYELKGE